jgi:hypothetical protein
LSLSAAAGRSSTPGNWIKPRWHIPTPAVIAPTTTVVLRGWHPHPRIGPTTQSTCDQPTACRFLCGCAAFMPPTSVRCNCHAPGLSAFWPSQWRGKRYFSAKQGFPRRQGPRVCWPARRSYDLPAPVQKPVKATLTPAGNPPAAPLPPRSDRQSRRPSRHHRAAPRPPRSGRPAGVALQQQSDAACRPAAPTAPP